MPPSCACARACKHKQATRPAGAALVPSTSRAGLSVTLSCRVGQPGLAFTLGGSRAFRMRPRARRGAALAGRFLFCWRRPSQPYSPRSHQTDRARWTHVERGRGQTGEGWIWRRQTWARRRRLLWRWERRAAPRPQQPRRRRRAEAWRVWVRGLGRIGGAGEDLGTPVCWGLRARARACLAEAYTRGSNLCFLCSWSRTSRERERRTAGCFSLVSLPSPLSPTVRSLSASSPSPTATHTHATQNKPRAR